MALLVVIGVCVALGLISAIVEKAATIRKNKAADLAKRESKLKQENDQLARARASFEQYRTAAQNGIEALAKEKALGFPWLARAYAEYFEILDGRVATNLRNERNIRP